MTFISGLFIILKEIIIIDLYLSLYRVGAFPIFAGGWRGGGGGDTMKFHCHGQDSNLMEIK